MPHTSGADDTLAMAVAYSLHESARNQPRELCTRPALLLGAGSLLMLAGLVASHHVSSALMMVVGSVPATEKVIYLVRHGEKTFDPANHSAYDYACLSEKGWARAYNLKSLFGPRAQPPFRTPDALFSADYGNVIDCRDHNGYYRTQATIAPLAASEPGGLGLPVDNASGWLPHLCSPAVRGECLEHDMADPLAEPHLFGMCCNSGAALAIKTKLRESGVQTLLVAWEHANLPHLAVALGAPECDPHSDSPCDLAWSGADYDQVWALYFDADGRFVRLDAELRQGFSTPAHPYLGPQRGCGTVAPSGFANPRRAG